eukprot:6757146-Karenia_brevis.AAC.1
MLSVTSRAGLVLEWLCASTPSIAACGYPCEEFWLSVMLNRFVQLSMRSGWEVKSFAFFR